MAGYIGKVQIGSTDPVLIGSTLYGICNTPPGTTAKTVGADANNSGNYLNNNFNNLINGTTIHIKFLQGNTVTTGVTLRVGITTQAIEVIGIPECPANTILSFTLDENQHWIVNDNIDTNTEYVFKTAYNATTNRALSEADIGDAAEKNLVSALTDTDQSVPNTNVPTATAVVQYVLTKTAGLSGLSGAMHFKGTTESMPPSGTYDAGDVVLGPNHKEYVYNGINWIELGDEGSYVLQTSQTTAIIDEVTEWQEGTLPQLTVTDTNVSQVIVTTEGVAASLEKVPISVPNVTRAGTATTASVSNGVLNIIFGNDTELGTAVQFDAVGEWSPNTPTAVTSTPVTVGSASGWNAGALSSLTQTPTTVVVPVTSP